MIIITGGAGFIGSFLQAELHARGEETVVVDWLGHEEKWRNLQLHAPSTMLSPADLDAFLSTDPPVRAVFHMGAISETTATDGDLVWRTNVTLSQRLWTWCAKREISFIYASSAATYGAAASMDAFSDIPAKLDSLRPLNLYGWSKHVFDQWVMRRIAKGEKAPPQWAGLKFFNVYGPNEYHKGKMISVIKVKFDEIRRGQSATLFRSDDPLIEDGHQARDFIWVGDVIAVMLWLLDHPEVSGLFNCGTGTARTYLDLTKAIFAALDVTPTVSFVDMPTALHGKYQNFTCADMSSLCDKGYDRQFTPLETGIERYIKDYLIAKTPYR
ncbi:ADP-glyceromanno-heptose 6-epimerase [Gluconobacter wancherniae]|uniref:ADP-L-glycero-D-manno-heptose-6-epimerase n=1 Tax=Gluconobacter wancherniae NBRC 103581 TaxID=656744 RepID=A0A511AZR7_9PROT|nr:ADP-glyceromanno-heptose 6-epimerase [Gluconobacter wancherniae]MBF0854489.1 ADP-glyceromanno-heptose 6-epimerase [Gluconobacter wancherniae]GBD57550.1 ADP-L-glycero-D-manno-heptose-6-epimerase [Gluconobacter wancherniae NBRC 103581]GBR62871.1 ADP-L-glycero-D-manno-heptose-6-epimerase [Gluconobacter wancherniae NBRC 103581]GEK93678.1 ADP-L-glycero-D-manno-heptose-6-epimerase [Gluconobacter wancherniae NBRC 103581]